MKFGLFKIILPETSVIIAKDSRAAYWTCFDESPNNPMSSLMEPDIKISLTFSGSPYRSKENALMLACLFFQFCWEIETLTNYRTRSLYYSEPF